MKSAINTETGKYLTQTAYDQWLSGQGNEPAPLWTEDIDQAATFDISDAPPAQFADGINLKLVAAV
jgi:hypothetical protein